MRSRLLLATIVALIGASLTLWACGGKGLGTGTTGQAIKAATTYSVSPLPEGKRWTPRGWQGPDLGGGTLTSSAFTGSVTVVNFWASWCGPCRAEQAELEALYKEYAQRGVRFVGINIRDTRTNARAHVEEFGVTYPSLFARDSSIAHDFRVLFIPTTYVLDPDGRIAARVIGPTRDEDLRRLLDGEIPG